MGRRRFSFLVPVVEGGTVLVQSDEGAVSDPVPAVEVAGLAATGLDLQIEWEVAVAEDEKVNVLL